MQGGVFSSAIVVTRRHSRDGLDYRDPAPTESLDDLVGLEEDRRNQGEAEGLSGFEVDAQLELRRLLHG